MRRSSGVTHMHLDGINPVSFAHWAGNSYHVVERLSLHKVSLIKS